MINENKINSTNKYIWFLFVLKPNYMSDKNTEYKLDKRLYRERNKKQEQALLIVIIIAL